MRGLDPALCFSLAPFALIWQTHVFARDQRHFGWLPLLISLLTPFAMRLLVANTPSVRRILRRALAWFIYPLACYAYLSAGSLLSAESLPRCDPFENAHNIVPAAEMMRGERAYRDIVPVHGFIQDALLDYALMRHGDRTIGQLLRGRKAISMLSAIAYYFVGVAAIGSMEFGVITFFFANSIGIADIDFRFFPSLIALALILFAVRKRRSQLLAYAAAAVVFAFMTSIDFGAYLGIVLLFALTRFHGARLRALTSAAVGGAIAAVVTAIAIGANGILSDFIRVTFRQIPRVAPAYALGVFDTPTALGQARSMPEALYAFLEGSSYIYMIWGTAMIFFAVALPVRPKGSTRRRARLDTLLVIASAMIVFVFSYAERHHLYVQMIVPQFLIVSVFMMSRARLGLVRLAAPLLAALVLVDAHPTYHLAITAALRHARVPLEFSWQEIGEIPRARGALFRLEEKTMIQTARRYFQANLGPDDTFFDFTNRGLLYFLFNRDCPVPYVEVGFYEDEKLQREVINRLERNPHVRLAIIPRQSDYGLDGVDSRIRAPLVWQYLQQRFTPAATEGQLMFWRRK